VNNAGILRDRMITSMSEDDFDAVISVNLKGTFNVTKHAWRRGSAQRKRLRSRPALALKSVRLRYSVSFPSLRAR